MADIAVQFLVENLYQLLLHNAELILGIKDDVEELMNDLSAFKAVLQQATQSGSSNNNEVLKDLVKKIRMVVFEAEDAIDRFVIEAKKHKDRGLGVLDLKYAAKVRNVAKEIKGIRDKVLSIRQNNKDDIRDLHKQDLAVKRHEAPVVEEDDVVGFDEEAKKIIDRLTRESNDLEVISIHGMAGLGKTTLARKVYKDSTLEYKFMTRGWIYVSQSYDRKEVLLQILSIFTENIKAYRHMPLHYIADVVRDKLNKGKYLLVLDDVWNREDWDEIKTVFPDGKCGSRILVTTRHLNVARHANTVDAPHDLKFLKEDESLLLLNKRVFRADSCPFDDLKEVGKRIAIKCDGLPLAIVVIAGALSDKSNSKHEWETVADNISDFLKDNKKHWMKLVGMSYDNLPYDLKACFLYFASFPQGRGIPAKKLIRLWVAEGFIQKPGQQRTAEQVAEEQLNELVYRSLVMITARSFGGRIKVCRVHDTLLEFCKDKADQEENILKEIKVTPSQPLPPQGELDSYRRLCVHSTILDFLSRKPKAERVRSFLSFSSSNQAIELPLQFGPTIPLAFPLLRVMEVESLKFTRFPPELKAMYHLRYISISSNYRILPKPIGDLWNMQFLIVNTTEATLDVRANIWNMSRLIHFQTNTSAQLPTPPAAKSKDGLISGTLQTLATISPKSCTEEVLARTPNVRKLGIRGNLAVLFDTKGEENLFENLGKLDSVESLKLLNTQPSDDLHLPPAYKFPRRLRKLTISNTSLGWKDMSILGKLEELEVLKLKENAFKGVSWEPEDDGFCCLEILYIERSELVSWEASKHHFPRLKCLILKHCDKLQKIPSGLADISNFQVLDLNCTTMSAAECARMIQKLKLESSQRPEGTKTKRMFKLSIYPPEH